MPAGPGAIPTTAEPLGTALQELQRDDGETSAWEAGTEQAADAGEVRAALSGRVAETLAAGSNQLAQERDRFKVND